MRKVLTPFASLALLSLAAASPTPVSMGGVIYAAGYGVKANATYAYNGGLPTLTGTSDDVALKAAIDACSAAGAKLVLPPGLILLNGTGGQSITLKNCSIEGFGQSAAVNDPKSWGTTFLLTSTTVAPFIIQSNFSLNGVSFFWPNQNNGTTVYPALFTILGADSVLWTMDRINIINGWDGFVGGDSHGTGGGIISNSRFWTQNDTFRLPYVGDSVHLNGVIFDPGNWLQICGFASGCKAAVDAHHNAAFRVVNVLNLSMDNTHFFDYDYVFKVETGGSVGITNVNFEFDGVATLIDTSATGSSWGPGNLITGTGDCNRYNYTTNSNSGHAPCFNMGVSSLTINQMSIVNAAGSVVETTTGNVTLLNSEFAGIGGAADGGDYYVVHSTANSGGLVITVRGNSLQGQPSSTKTHGIKTDVAASRLVVQDNYFGYFNDDLTAQSTPTTIVTGNWSISTQGSSSISSASLATGGNGVMYSANAWDKPPVSVIGGCTAGSSIVGAFSGVLTVCSTNPTSTFTVTLPWTPYGGGVGMCSFIDSAGTGLITSQSGLTWTIASVGSVDIHGHVIRFNCPGQQ